MQENAAGGTVVAQLGAVDPDAGETFTYALTEPSSLFDVVGNQLVLRTGADIDFEAAASYQLALTVTDTGDLSHTETFTLAVTNENEAPLDLLVTGGVIQENAGAGAVVAELSAADADDGETFTYALAEPSSLFEVAGSQIVIRSDANLDYEVASSHQLTVKVTDSGGLSRTELVEITVANENEAPTAITISGGTVQENADGGTVVAQLAGVDADAGEAFTYALAEPSSLFEIVGNKVLLSADASLDYETAGSHQLAVTVTDADGLSHSDMINITVGNQNEAPTDIIVTGGSVQENTVGGIVVAQLGAADQDTGDSFTYALTEASELFDIVGNSVMLRAGASINYEAATSHQLNVDVTDSGGLTYNKIVSIAVTDQNEAPTDIVVAGGSRRRTPPAVR